MNKYISMLKKGLLMLLIFSIMCFFLSILYCYTNISYRFISSILLLFMIIIFFAFGYSGGRKQENKGFIYGLKYGCIICFILYLMGGILFSFSLSLYKISYYLILLLSCVFGSILGINRKK